MNYDLRKYTQNPLCDFMKQNFMIKTVVNVCVADSRRGATLFTKQTYNKATMLARR